MAGQRWLHVWSRREVLRVSQRRSLLGHSLHSHQSRAEKWTLTIPNNGCGEFAGKVRCSRAIGTTSSDQTGICTTPSHALMAAAFSDER